MADINQLITLGIGTPGDIEHFILVGLNANPSVAATIVGEILGEASYAPEIDGVGSARTEVAGRAVRRDTLYGRGAQ